MDCLELFLGMNVYLDSVVPNREAAIAFAADRLAGKVHTGYERIKSALLSREKLGSTALGRGVALPHAILHHRRQPACAFIRLASPLHFDAPDELGVDVMLALIWPQNDKQGLLSILSAAGRLLTDPAMLRLVREADDADLIRRSIYFGMRTDMRRSMSAHGDHGDRVAAFGTWTSPSDDAPEAIRPGLAVRYAAHGLERQRGNG